MSECGCPQDKAPYEAPQGPRAWLITLFHANVRKNKGFARACSQADPYFCFRLIWRRSATRTPQVSECGCPQDKAPYEAPQGPRAWLITPFHASVSKKYDSASFGPGSHFEMPVCMNGFRPLSVDWCTIPNIPFLHTTSGVQRAIYRNLHTTRGVQISKTV